jgi:hypothetical protein
VSHGVPGSGPVAWLAARDRGFGALRRAARTAIVMPALFAIAHEWIGRATLATFAAFGAFAMLLLVDFQGTIRARVQAQVSLGLACAALVALGTLASRTTWLAVLGMFLVAFAVLFAGIVSSVLAGASTAMLLAYVLPATLPGGVGSIPERAAGWGLSAAVSVAAIALLWPAPARDPVRAAAIAACRALAARLRAESAWVLGRLGDAGHDDAVAAATAAMDDLHARFFATPYRPTGLSTSARTGIRLVDELKWLDGVIRAGGARAGQAADPRACAVKDAAAALLEAAADLLERPARGPAALHAASAALSGRLGDVEAAALALPPPMAGAAISALDPGFRAQELAFVVAQIARNADLAAAADRRPWREQLVGRVPDGLTGPLGAAQERAVAHVGRHSLWLRSSLRGAAALAGAVLVADLAHAQHGFWVAFGTLAVLRSNALSTGQSLIQGVLGTTAGFVVGAALVALVGTERALLWALLPPAVLLAGLAPAAISFAAGQAGFTLVLLILFNLLEPAGWALGLVRIEDVALGGAVSLAVGLVFWPRGAAAALGTALGDAYADCARYLAAAVRYGIARCDAGTPELPPPADAAARAAAASRRLDDTFRQYLAERGPKPLPLAEATSLVTGIVGLRLAGDAVLALWQGDTAADGDRAAARGELDAAAGRVADWFVALGGALAGAGAVPEPQPADAGADGRLLDAVAHDLRGADGRATAVRMIWTGDHLDAARRLEGSLTEPARAAAG